MGELEDLQAKRLRIVNRIDAIESAERRKSAEALVGKCFRYRNSYSCHKDDSERWWMYTRVVGVTDSGWVRVFSFQRCLGGKIEIDINARHSQNLGEPITQKQYEHAWKVMARMVNSEATKAGAYKP